MAEEPNNDKYEGRLLIAFNALIDGQKRMLRFMETAIEKYSGVDMEIAKFNRKLNAVQAELLARTDAVQGDICAQMAKLNDGVFTELAKVAGKVDALTTKVDAVSGRVDALSSKIDALSGRVDALVGRMDALVARF